MEAARFASPKFNELRYSLILSLVLRLSQPDVHCSHLFSFYLFSFYRFGTLRWEQVGRAFRESR